MALVASIFPLWTLIAVVVHILFMGNFIYIFDKPYFCSYNCCTNYFFSIMLGTVFLFHFIATNDGPQKFKISFFYIVCGLENVACSVIFYLWVDKATNHYWQLYLVVIWICFVFGLAFKVIYYRWFHPNITAKEKTPEKKRVKEVEAEVEKKGLQERSINGAEVTSRKLTLDEGEIIKKKRPLNNSIIHPVEGEGTIVVKQFDTGDMDKKADGEAVVEAVTRRNKIDVSDRDKEGGKKGDPEKR